MQHPTKGNCIMPKTDVTPTGTGDLAAPDTFPVLTEVERWLTEPGYVIPWPSQDAETAAADINRQLLESDDPLATRAAGLKLEQAVGVSFQLRSVRFLPSDETSGAAAGGAYAILEGPSADGELLTLITGSQKVLAAALALVKRNQLGRWVMVQQGGTSARGRDFYELVAGNEPFAS
jgi:hypothetical protein